MSFVKKYPEWSLAALCSVLGVLVLCIFPYIFGRSFGYIVLALACVQLLWALCTKRGWLQNILLVSLSCCFALFIGGIFLQMQSPNVSMTAVRLYDGKPKNPAVRDDVLGFGYAHKAMSMRTQKFLNDKEVFDVVVSFNDQGRRITPVHPQAKKAVVLLGCSFTEGVGVEDAETYAYQLATLLGDTYQVYNFGFGGYGPHQALALLESSRVDFLKEKYEKLYFYFLNIEEHEWRSAGLVEWDNYGPRYILHNGEAVRHGSFDMGMPLLTKLWETVKKSDLMQRFFLRKILWNQEEALALQMAILKKSQEIIQEKFHSPFTVILSPLLDSRENAYKTAGLHTVNLRSVLPDWPEKGTTIPNDGHPTPYAHEQIAKKLAEDIQKTL